MIDILGMSGSLRAASCNTALLHAASDLATPKQRVSRWSDLAAVPPFNEDHEHEPDAAVVALRRAVQRCDALLIATPEYNTTLPGQLKNALDWLSRPDDDNALSSKPVSVIGASQSPYGAQWSQQAVRQVLSACGAELVDAALHVPHCDTAFTADYQLRGDAQRRALVDTLTDLTNAARSAASNAPSSADVS